jgi:hypothetical protein
MKGEGNRLRIDDFASLFGTDRASLPGGCVELIENGDWSYVPLEGERLDDVLREFLERIRQKNFSIVANDDKSRWIRGWSENLDSFVASKGDTDALAPKYIRPNMPVRLFRRFVLPGQSRFELNWYRVFQEWLFRTYLTDCETIFEFGSGSGINVGLLAQMFPDKKIVGLDWAEPACEIVNSMRRLRGWNTEGRPFDFFKPDHTLDIPPNSIVFTVGALEQTSTRHGAFIDFLLAKKPKLCVFIEPIYEWYDPANLADHLALRAHDLRNFWRGFPGRLQQLAQEGRVEIIKQKRADFGSLVLEGYSQNIWRPL